MQMHQIVAEQLGLTPLFIEGPNAYLRYKFVLIDDQIVYGNIRSHWDLVNWLLQGPLGLKYPLMIAQAQPIIETNKVLTVFGGWGLDDKIEMQVYIFPDTITENQVVLQVTEAIQAHLTIRAVA